MARISTHVLDIARGLPAAGVRVELYRGGVVIASAVTNADGRTNEPILSGDVIESGVYELLFHAGAYLGVNGTFLDTIPIRFVISDPGGNYHVPLLLAPHGYSTYRGS